MSYAADGCDLAIISYFPEDYRGTYLDIGASEPLIDSNTFLLYIRGWRGLCIEPCLEMYKKHLVQRPEDDQLNVAISSFQGKATYFKCNETSVSTLNPHEATLRAAKGQDIEERMVEVRTVSDIAQYMGSIPDVLSIDVEGLEREVLEGCPFETGWLPKLIVLEACRPCTDIPCYDEWEHIVLSYGYEYRETRGVNRIFQVGVLV